MKHVRYVFYLGLHAAMVRAAFPREALNSGNFTGMEICSNTFKNLTHMTYEQCLTNCGHGWARYDGWESAGSIINWVFPLFALVGNMHFPEINIDIRGCRLYYFISGFCNLVITYGFVACHLLSDPIDTIWSLLDKLRYPGQILGEIDRRSRSWLRENDNRLEDGTHHIATVFATLDNFELYDRDVPSDDSLAGQLLQFIPENVRDAAPEVHRLLEACKESAAILRTSRAMSFRRSILAILVYASMLFASFAGAEASNSTPVHTPHTVALRELYFWLNSAIILSSVNGSFSNQEAEDVALEPVRKAVRYLQSGGNGGNDFRLPPSRPWNGATAVWRPLKISKRRSLPFLAAAWFPVAVAWMWTFVMSYFTPTVGLGCRGITEVTYFVAWYVSLFLTWVSTWSLGNRQRLLFWLVFVKDIIFAGGMISILYAAFIGWWNSCYCWSGGLTLGVSQHLVPTNLLSKEQNMRGFYFSVTGGALSAQLLIGLIAFFYFHSSRKVLYGAGEHVEGVI